jgi:cysteine-rich repeat protein
VRSKIVHQVLARAIRCQRAIDRTATSFGLISPTCLVAAQNVAARARTIVQACAGFTGADVGSCSPLPTCVIASATQTGHDLAVATYGFSPEQQGDLCGNGQVDPGESCDEGAANSPTGACTDECLKATCGDGKVEAGVEECDSGSQPGSTSPKTDDPNCDSSCKLTRCGDGVVQIGGSRPDEQCDDGNNVAGDGCSPTCQFETVSCPVGGTIDVTVTFVSGPDTFSSGNVAGIDMSVGYPPSVGFPGSQFLPLEDPSDPASRLILLGGPYNLYDGTVVTFFDYDTSIRTVISGGQVAGNSGFLIFNFPEIPFERIRFDCVSDAPLTRAAFPCTISKMVNQIGGDVPPSAQPECKVTLPQ